MKITRLYKSLAALIILFFFVFGAFAVSLANESPTIGGFYSADVRLVMKDVAVGVKTLNSLFQLATGEIVTSPLADDELTRFMGQRFDAPMEQSLAGLIHVPKVSLQIFQSILLL